MYYFKYIQLLWAVMSYIKTYTAEKNKNGTNIKNETKDVLHKSLNKVYQG